LNFDSRLFLVDLHPGGYFMFQQF